MELSVQDRLSCLWTSSLTVHLLVPFGLTILGFPGINFQGSKLSKNRILQALQKEYKERITVSETRRSQERRNIAEESRRAWLWRKEMQGMWNVQLNSVEARSYKNFYTNLSKQSVRIIPVEQTVGISFISDSLLVLLICHLCYRNTSSLQLLFCFSLTHLCRLKSVLVWPGTIPTESLCQGKVIDVAGFHWFIKKKLT